jgi:hypothetical protein
MRTFFLLSTLGLALTLPTSAESDSANGNLIRNPALSDYREASRSPGFSPVTDVIDADGAAVTSQVN